MTKKIKRPLIRKNWLQLAANGGFGLWRLGCRPGLWSLMVSALLATSAECRQPIAVTVKITTDLKWINSQPYGIHAIADLSTVKIEVVPAPGLSPAAVRQIQDSLYARLKLMRSAGPDAAHQLFAAGCKGEAQPTMPREWVVISQNGKRDVCR